MYNATVFLIYVSIIVFAFVISEIVFNAMRKHYLKKERVRRKEIHYAQAKSDTRKINDTYQNLILKQIMEGSADEY